MQLAALFCRLRVCLRNPRLRSVTVDGAACCRLVALAGACTFAAHNGLPQLIEPDEIGSIACCNAPSLAWAASDKQWAAEMMAHWKPPLNSQMAHQVSGAQRVRREQSGDPICQLMRF